MSCINLTRSLARDQNDLKKKANVDSRMFVIRFDTFHQDAGRETFAACLISCCFFF